MRQQERACRHSTEQNGDAPVQVRLKWFNATKGFGFVVPEAAGGDAFLHVTLLQKAGIQALGEGAILECVLEQGIKGLQVESVIGVPDAGDLTEPIFIHTPFENTNGLSKLCGVVKWYKIEDGFGFIVPEDGMKDIFIHKSCLQRCGIDPHDLLPGRRVIMAIRPAPKGREATDIMLDPVPYN
jgi:cold shock protein